MNYLPFAGYWFYGGASSAETASFFASCGLLAIAPIVGISRAVFATYYRFRRLS